MDAIERLGSHIVFLFSDGGQSPIGTGFVIGQPFPAEEGAFIPIIVTAKHVIGDRPQVIARFSMLEASMPGYVIYNLEEQRASGDYWEHPDEGVDIAAFRTHHIKGLDYRAVPPTLIATASTLKDEDIGVGDRVVIPSMLWRFMGESRNFPVFRRGDIALIPSEKVPLKYEVGSLTIETRQELLFIDATAIQGASGSPVFLWPGPRVKQGAFTLGGITPYLLGVLHGFYPAFPRELLEIETATSKAFFAENSGIAIVFPAQRILEVLERPDLRSRLADLLVQYRAKQHSSNPPNNSLEPTRTAGENGE